MTTKGQAAEMAVQAVTEYESQIQAYSARHQSLVESAARNNGKLRSTCDRLAHGLVVSIDTESVGRAASETGCLDLPVKLQELFAQRRAAEERKSGIEATAQFQNREILLHPQTGEFSEKIAQHESLVTTFEQDLQRFELAEFRWLYARGAHEAQAQSAFQSFLRVVTLADHREQRALGVVREVLGDQPFASLVDDFKRAESSVDFHRQELETWRGKHKNLTEVVAHHAELVDWLDRFETIALDFLRKSLSKHLQETDFDLLHQSLRKEGRILAAQCHALQKKVSYFEDMRRFLEKEMDDRRERCRSIRRVHKKWSVNPHQYVSGDKTKWLQTLPRQKRQSTSKQVRWIDTMHYNVDSYDDYDQYDSLMNATAAFVAYDAFAMSADERMPYEGFSRSVIGELDTFRTLHGMEKPDYRELRSMIDESASEAEAESSSDWDETDGRDGDAAVVAVAAVALMEAQDAMADGLGAEES